MVQYPATYKNPITPAKVITPESGEVALFFDSTNSNKLSVKNSAGVTSEVGGIDQPSIREVSASGDILSTDYTLYVTSSSATTQTLPTAIGINGKVYNIKNLDSTENGVVTINTTSDQTIDVINTSVVITYPQSLTVQSTGANWIII